MISTHHRGFCGQAGKIAGKSKKGISLESEKEI